MIHHVFTVTTKIFKKTVLRDNDVADVTCNGYSMTVDINNGVMRHMSSMTVCVGNTSDMSHMFRVILSVWRHMFHECESVFSTCSITFMSINLLLLVWPQKI